MSLFSTLRTGASGLGASGKSMAVIGDNIANINTTGFKGSRATFADSIPQAIASLGGPRQLGTGSVTANVQSSFSQGMLQTTGSALDVAIQGRGFFQVADGASRYYTRDGSFNVDANGLVVTSTGHRVQGYGAVDGVLSSQIGDITLDVGPIPQRETTAITADIQLAADENNLQTTLATHVTSGDLDGTGLTMQELGGEAQFSTSVTVYDSLGVPHDVTVFFERNTASQSAGSQWTWVAAIDGAEIETSPGDGAFEIANGTLTFGTDGELDPATLPTQVQSNQPWSWPGADTFDFNLQLGLDTAGNEIAGSVRMADSESSVATISQDGFTTGNLTGVRVDPDGTINASYTNGEELVLGQVGLAIFQAEGGLERVGGNLFRATSLSGDAAIGAAGTGGRGVTTGYALERSNVELEDEFVLMIQSQRAYQASARVVSTADETLQELVNLV